MHPDLEAAFTKLVEILKGGPRCKGGWHYGSVGRGESDDYSDYDPVWLVGDEDFIGFCRGHAEVHTAGLSCIVELCLNFRY